LLQNAHGAGVIQAGPRWTLSENRNPGRWAGALLAKINRRLYPSRREPVVDAAAEDVIRDIGGHVDSERQSGGREDH
jgi:hypothetical protein